jgi:hypothetical protein
VPLANRPENPPETASGIFLPSFDGYSSSVGTIVFQKHLVILDRARYAKYLSVHSNFYPLVYLSSKSAKDSYANYGGWGEFPHFSEEKATGLLLYHRVSCRGMPQTPRK